MRNLFALPQTPPPVPVDSLPFPEWFPFFMHWKAPLTIALIYAVAVKYFNTKQPDGVSRVQAKQLDKPVAASRLQQSSLFTAVVFLHNLALCVYSAVTFMAVVPVVVRELSRQSLVTVVCDRELIVWHDAMYYWGYLFYLSKYYEVIDTAIILLKGRKSSTLQTYHHSGAIICMWAGIQFQAMPIWLFVILNSFVHTIMYFYYMCTSIGIHPPGKKYITTMQITQFLVGITAAASFYFFSGCPISTGHAFAIWLNIAYLFPLTYLFVEFAIKTYSKRSKAKAA
ncbi:hypothetical protein H4R35_002579 [Dimargaris xerosporica]|nr:hypothetical protein H4R35_002579 [Dimargaris xerosporica]